MQVCAAQQACREPCTGLSEKERPPDLVARRAHSLGEQRQVGGRTGLRRVARAIPHEQRLALAGLAALVIRPPQADLKQPDVLCRVSPLFMRRRAAPPDTDPLLTC